VFLTPLCFLVKDIIALVALLPVEVNSDRADLYYIVAFLPGTVYVSGTRAIVFNVIIGIVLGLALPRLLTYSQRNIGFSVVRGIAGGVMGGALWLLIIMVATGGIAAWQWFVVGMVFSFVPFAIVGGVVAIGILMIESWMARTVGLLPRALFGIAIATAIRIYSPLASCKPYYEPCTFTGVARDLLFYGITIGATAGILAGFRTQRSVS